MGLRPNTGLPENDIQSIVGWEDGKPPLFDVNKFRLTFAGVTVITTCTAFEPFHTKAKAIGTLDGSYDVGGSVPASPVLPITVREYASFDTTCVGTFSTQPSGSPQLLCGSNYFPYLTDGGLVVEARVGPYHLFQAFIPRCDCREGVVVNNFLTAAGDVPGVILTVHALGTGGTCTINRLCCDCA